MIRVMTTKRYQRMIDQLDYMERQMNEDNMEKCSAKEHLKSARMENSILCILIMVLCIIIAIIIEQQKRKW